MRRLGLTWVVALALSTTLFAAGNQPTTEKWSGKVNVARLSRFLDLSSAQYDNVEKICLYFNEQMERANNSRKSSCKRQHIERICPGFKTELIKFWT